MKELIDQTIVLDLALRKGFALAMEDVTFEEFLALTVLWAEQDKHRAEEIEDQRREAQHAAQIPAGYKTRPI